MADSNATPGSGLSSKTKLALVAGGAALVVGAAAIVKRTFFTQEEGKVIVDTDNTVAEDVSVDTRKKTKKIKSKKTKKPISEQELLDDVQKSLQSITTTGVFGELETKILKRTKRVTSQLEKYSARLKLEVSSWLIVYSTLRMLTAKTQEEAKEISDNQTEDIEAAWNCLDFDRRELQSSDDRNRFLMSKVDLAQRLRKIDVLETMLDEMLQDIHSTGSVPLCVVSFTTAASVGRWREFCDMGNLLETNGQPLNDFHLAAAQRQDLPDYKVLFDIVSRDEMKLEKSDTEWKLFVIESGQITFESVHCSDPSSEAQIRDSFSHDQGQAVGNTGKHIMRAGNVIQGVSVSTLSIAVVGPYIKGKLYLEGFMDVDQPPMGTFRQREIYDLDLKYVEGQMHHYEGTYRIFQEQNTQSEAQVSSAVEMSFRMELVLREDETFQ